MRLGNIVLFLGLIDLDLLVGKFRFLRCDLIFLHADTGHGVDDLRIQVIDLLLHQIQDPDLGPILGQQLRLCRADAACTAGDNDDLILYVRVKSLPFMRYALASLSFHALAGFCTPILPPLISSVVPVI